MNSVMLHRALTDSADPALRPLPDAAADLLVELAAPPRLAAHLRAVHDVAWQLVAWVESRYPAVSFDRVAVLFGAATHDVGKVVHVAELSGPGSAHEQTGYQLLLDHGVDPGLARFAWTHASWQSTDIEIEDLLVSVADKVWKAKRVADLEQRLVDRLAAVAGQQSWEAFMTLDDELGRIAADADRRLAFQASYPVFD
ncbi:HD domain-containing protein [Nocardia sp. NPDC060256]|uniref:HD domain-containing protein n=1 Tax=unclassified Nocardia TaxID=2637762 RepID=UPI00365EEB6B